MNKASLVNEFNSLQASLGQLSDQPFLFGRKLLRGGDQNHDVKIAAAAAFHVGQAHSAKTHFGFVARAGGNFKNHLFAV